MGLSGKTLVLSRFIWGQVGNGSAFIIPWQRCRLSVRITQSKKSPKTSLRGPQMNGSNFSKLALMCAASVVALTAGARAQQDASNAGPEQVTVTGSRVISDISLSPTPLTVVTSEQLQATTPTDIP